MTDSSPCFITKSTYKAMKYLYSHEDVTLGKLAKKFKKCTVSDFLYLIDQHMAVYKVPNSSWTFDTTHTSNDGIISLVDAGCVYVEKRLSYRSQWICATLISLASLIVSTAALIVSIVK